MSEGNPVIPEADKITIAVNLRVILDARQWAEYNGLMDRDRNRYLRSAVRKDVQNHLFQLVSESTLVEEADGTVSF